MCLSKGSALSPFQQRLFFAQAGHVFLGHDSASDFHDLPKWTGLARRRHRAIHQFVISAPFDRGDEGARCRDWKMEKKWTEEARRDEAVARMQIYRHLGDRSICQTGEQRRSHR